MKPKQLEAINELCTFLESDLYSKFRPKEEVEGEIFYREDALKDEKDFVNYIRYHFNLLLEELKDLEDSE